MKIRASVTRDLEDKFVPILQNCAKILDLKKIHVHILNSSLSQSNFLTTKMVDLCNTHYDPHYANLLFNQIIEPNIFLYNAILKTYTLNHLYTQAFTIYKQIIRRRNAITHPFPDKFTYPIVLKGCASFMCIKLGKQVHGHVCKFGPVDGSVIGNSLMEMYGKCENMMDAQKVFETMAERDVVSWNTLVLCHARLGQMGKAREIFDLIPVKTVVSWTVMISGYARTGCYGDALDVFHRMQLVGMKPDEISVVAVLSACTQLGALELGKWIHFYCERNGFLKNICVCNAFIEMYAKCGSIDEACEFFEKMWEKDVISWSTIIVALAKHGRAREAIQRFTEMERSRVLPNGITFLGILSACAHAGLLSEGLHYFDLLKENYFIDPTVEHYGCMVDLLGRLGYLDRAFEFINSMPIKPDASIWGSLLGASRTHEHLELAVTAMEHLVELEPDDASNYILLSNTYAAAGKWDSVLRMRKLMRSNSMKKTPGCSSIEVNNVVQEFIAGDDSNSSFDEIHSMLDLLVLQQS